MTAVVEPGLPFAEAPAPVHASADAASRAPRVSPVGRQTVRIGAVAPIVGRGMWLLVETVLVPMLLLWVLLQTKGPTAGLCAVLAWRLGAVGVRAVRRVRVPASVWLSVGVFGARTVLGLVFASVTLYLWPPVIMGAVLGLVFLASAAGGRPIADRLVADVVTLPAVLKNDPRVQRLFVEITYLWGGVQAVGAVVGAWSMRLPVEQTVLVHGGLGVWCTAMSAGSVAVWGWWRMRGWSDVQVRFGCPDAGSVD